MKEAGNDYFDIGDGNDYMDEENIVIEMWNFIIHPVFKTEQTASAIWVCCIKFILLTVLLYWL